MSELTFDAALEAMRNGAHAGLCGMTLTVNGVALAITEEQFEQAWDAMGPLEAEDVISLASTSSGSAALQENPQGEGRND